MQGFDLQLLPQPRFCGSGCHASLSNYCIPSFAFSSLTFPCLCRRPQVAASFVHLDRLITHNECLHARSMQQLVSFASHPHQPAEALPLSLPTRRPRGKHLGGRRTQQCEESLPTETVTAPSSVVST